MALDETRLIVSIDSRNAERDTRNITRELQNLERGGNQASNSMGSLSAATRSLAGYMGGLLTVAAAVNKMDVYTGLQNRLKLVTNSQTELNTAMNDTFAIAQKTASSWDSAAMVYQRFADNAVRLNITMKETAALTETVAKAISVSGGSAASAEAALMQFGQALASGVLRGEEFNSIAEQAPGLLKAIAFGLDTNVGSLRAMAAAGKITGDVLVQSLTKAQPYIDDLFNKTDFTIAASFTKLSNEVTKFIGEAGKGSGAAAGLSDAISVLAENLGTIANIAVIGGVAMLTKAIATQTVAIHGSISAMVQRRALEIAGLQNNIRMAALEVQRTRTVAALAATEINLSRVEYNNASTRAARAAATVRLTQAEIAHRIALNQTTAATAAQTAAEGALTSARSFGVRALALVGGPIGALTIGVAALAAGYLFLKDSSSGTNDSLSNQIEIVSELAQKYRELTLEKLINEMGELEKKQAQGSAQSSKAIAGIMGIVVATEYSTQAQKDRANEWNKIAIDVRNGAMLTGAAIGEMTKKGFTKEEIQKASAFFAEFNDGKVKANEAAQSIAFVAQQTGLYGDKLDETGKKIAEKKLIVKGLEGDYRSLSTQIDTNIQWLLQQDGALNASTEQQKNIANATDAWNSKTITASELAKALKANLPIDSGLLVGFDNLATKTDKAKKELNTANYELKQVQINGPKAKQGFAEAGQGAAGAENDVSKLNEKLAAFNKTLESRKWDAQFKLRLVQDKGYTEDRAEELLKAYKESVSKNAKNISSETGKALREAWTAEDQLKKVVDSRLEAEKKVTQEKNKQSKESEKQSKLNKNLGDGLVSNSHLKGLPIKSSESLAGGGVRGYTAEFAQILGKELKGSINAFTSFNDKYHQGKGGKHPQGQAFDLRLNGGTDSAKANATIKALADKYGYIVKTLDEYKSPSKNATGGHLHVSVTGRKKGANGANYNDLDVYADIDKRAKESADNQKQLTLDVATYQERVRSELKDKLEEVDKAGFSSQETARLKAEYTARADNEIAISQYALKTKLSDYEAFTKDEAQLLRESFDEKKFYAARDIELSNEQKTQALVLLDRQLKQELELIKAAKQQRLFQAEQAMMSESDIIKTRYELELNEISKIMDIEEQRRMIAVAEYTKKTDQNALSGKLQTNYDQLRGVDTSAAEAMNERQLKIDELRENDFIKQQEYENLSLQSRMKYSADMLNLNLSYGEQIAGAASSMFGAMMGEQSAAYKVMFAAEKAFAIARSVMAIQTGIAQASSLPFPLNLSAMLTVAMQTASIVSNIKAVADNGFKAGGYTGNLGTSQQAGVVHGQEFVLNAAATKRVGVDTLNAVNSGKGDLGGSGAVVQPIINIHTLAGETAEVTTNEDGSIDVRIRKVVGDYMQAEFSNQNSKTSQSLKQNFNIAPKR